MEQTQYNTLFSFIWNIATDVLVFAFDKSEYKKIILQIQAGKAKLVRQHFGTRHEDADVCHVKPTEKNCPAETDTSLRDTEQVPLLYPGGIDAFMKNEVLPYAPDTLYRKEEVVTGYELSFTKYFYKPVELRSITEITADINFLKFVSNKGYGNEILLSVTREQGVIPRNIDSKEENHNYIPDDLNGFKLVKPGQFVINKMKSWQGSYGVSNHEGIVSPAYYVRCLKFPCQEFFSMAIRSKAYIPFFTQYSKGIRIGQWDLSSIGLKNIPFIVPPLPVQQAIVSYIENKLQKIDTCIANLQSEIDYLKEFKQRLISDVVTGKIRVAKPQKGVLP